MLNIEEKRKKKNEAQKRYKLSKKGKATQARYYSSEAKRESCKRWRAKNFNKIIAHRIVNYAIKIGKISRMSCEICGKENAFAHHDDYSKPMDIRWLCNFHHSEHHRNN